MSNRLQRDRRQATVRRDEPGPGRMAAAGPVSGDRLPGTGSFPAVLRITSVPTRVRA